MNFFLNVMDLERLDTLGSFSPSDVNCDVANFLFENDSVGIMLIVNTMYLVTTTTYFLQKFPKLGLSIFCNEERVMLKCFVFADIS